MELVLCSYEMTDCQIKSLQYHECAMECQSLLGNWKIVYGLGKGGKGPKVRRLKQNVCVNPNWLRY